MPVRFQNESNGEIVNYGERHLCAAIVLDTGGDNQNIQNAVNEFLSAIKGDALARGRLDLCFITTHNGKVLHSFRPAWDYFSDMDSGLCVEINTEPTYKKAMFFDSSINLGMEVISQRMNQYKQCGIHTYRPWLMLITDREYYPDSMPIESSSFLDIFYTAQDNHQLIFMPVSVGVKTNTWMKNLFSDKTRSFVILPQKSEFEKAFVWLSKSSSTIGDLPIHPFYQNEEEIHIVESKIKESHVSKLSECIDKALKDIEGDSSVEADYLEIMLKNIAYIEALGLFLKKNDYSFETSVNDLGGIIFTLHGKYGANGIQIRISGNNAIIASGKKWYFPKKYIEKCPFFKCKLLKCEFEATYLEDQLLISFEHVMFLHSDPFEFSEHLMLIVERFDTEINEITHRFRLSEEGGVGFPPTPSIITVGI